MNNLDIWMQTYERNLKNAVLGYPREYAFEEEDIPTVLGRMKKAFMSGNYNKDTRAIKWTCHELKIYHTYKSINAFLSDVAPRLEKALNRQPVAVPNKEV